MSIDSSWDGRYVIDIQKALKRHGFDPGSADGKYGPRTKSAVSEFQKDRGLMVDGVVGQQTWRALGFQGQVPKKTRFDDEP